MQSDLDKIYRSISRFLYPLNLEETCATIIEEAQKLIKAKYGSIHLENPNQRGDLKRFYTTLPGASETSPRKRGFTYQAFRSKQSFIKYIEDFGQYHPQYKKLGIESNIFIPLINKNKSIGVLVVNSISKEKFTEEELNILKLFGTFASLAIKKAQLFEETKKALELRDLFISMAAHELKTPLTTINGYIHLLHNKIPQDDRDESRWIYQLVRESQRLNGLVDELLQVNRVKQGQLNYMFQECNLSDMVGRAIENFKLVKPERIVNFETQSKEESWIIGDFDKLLQVIANVLENASKFSPVDKPIDIQLVSEEGDLVLKVKDYGIGIAKKDIPKIFDGYFKVDKDSPEGMGIGLFLTQSIIKKHRGEIKVHSELDRGTIIEIRLPKTKLWMKTYQSKD